MREYFPVTDLRTECNITADYAKQIENEANELDISADKCSYAAEQKASESHNSAEASKNWAVEISQKNYEQTKQYADDALSIRDIARSYATGDSGYRQGEEEDNAKYYYAAAKSYLDQIQTATLDEVVEYVGMVGEIDGG